SVGWISVGITHSLPSSSCGTVTPIPYLAFLSFSISPARSDQYPVLNVTPVCLGIASQSSLEAGLKATSFDQCVKGEQDKREAMIREWYTFNSDDKRDCIAETTRGGESSYTVLITCLEIARDGRKMRSEERGSSAAQKASPTPGDTSASSDQQVPPA